jgi:pimeloyl-ACP methyl ester carboxylesterase
VERFVRTNGLDLWCETFGEIGDPAVVLVMGIGRSGIAWDDELCRLPFESDDLPANWPRLDDFEGPGYRRVVATVLTADGDLPACMYVLRRDMQRPRP